MQLQTIPESGNISEAKTDDRAICLFGGPLFDGAAYHDEGYVIIEGARVSAFGSGRPHTRCTIDRDVRGRLVAPGFVDLHCDALEKCIEQRPGAIFDHHLALESLDRRLAASGVTSLCHAVAFLDTEMGLRSPESATTIARSVQSYAASSRSLIRHGLHIRFEVGSTCSAKLILELLGEQPSSLFSVMDHTPGQGQFKTMESFRRYYSKTYAISGQEAERIGKERTAKNSHAWKDSLELLDTVRDLGIPLLSHDDDTGDKVDMIRDLGAIGSEFPVSLEAAARAQATGMHVCMGAPNLLRGKSTNNNVTAAEILKAGLCDAFVSDYYPESLPQSPFFASRQLGLDLRDLLPTVTANPGSLLEGGSMSLGRLQPGAEADLVIIDTEPPWVRIWETWVKGRRVYAAH